MYVFVLLVVSLKSEMVANTKFNPRFRLGLALYIPVYLLFPELRGLLNEKSTAPTLWGMMVISAVRYLASTCAYTAVMVSFFFI